MCRINLLIFNCVLTYREVLSMSKSMNFDARGNECPDTKVNAKPNVTKIYDVNCLETPKHARETVRAI